MPGNKNSGRRQTEKPFRDMLTLEISETANDKKKLREIARQLVAKAVNGDIQAIKEVADRLDGKPHQSTDTKIETDDPMAALLKSIAENGNRAGDPESQKRYDAWMAERAQN